MSLSIFLVSSIIQLFIVQYNYLCYIKYMWAQYIYCIVWLFFILYYIIIKFFMNICTIITAKTDTARHCSEHTSTWSHLLWAGWVHSPLTWWSLSFSLKRNLHSYIWNMIAFERMLVFVKHFTYFFLFYSPNNLTRLALLQLSLYSGRNWGMIQGDLLKDTDLKEMAMIWTQVFWSQSFHP